MHQITAKIVGSPFAPFHDRNAIDDKYKEPVEVISLEYHGNKLQAINTKNGQIKVTPDLWVTISFSWRFLFFPSF